MISTYKYNSVTWVDLESPTEDELLHVFNEYDVPEILLRDLIVESLLSKVDVYKDMMYLVLHFPRIHNENRMPDLEIDFILGKNFLITVHYEFSNALHDFSQKLEVDTLLHKNLDIKHAGHLFHAILEEAYSQSNNKLDIIYQMLEKSKLKIFNNNEDSMVSELSRINRKILDFRQALRFHSGILDSLESSGIIFFGEEYKIHTQSLKNRYRKLVGILEGHHEMLGSLSRTNDSLLSSKTNQTMRFLTIMSFVTFPLSLLATIFSIAANMGLLHKKEQLLYIICIIFLLGALMLIYFKHKKWL
jgi:magnesium transporter